MIQKIMQKICEYRLILFSEFWAALGVLMTLLKLLEMTFFKLLEYFFNCDTKCEITKGTIIIIISVLYTYQHVLKKTDNITLEINKRTKIYVHQADILQAEGVRVIPVNEYFDTHLGDNIINPKSLHGQFLSLFKGRIDELKQQIASQLLQKEKLPANRTRNLVPDLPQDRYPLGTCIRIIDNEQIYILVAITRFNSNEHVEVSTEEYPEIIRKMYDGIEQLCDGNAVNIPLVGSGISGYQLTNMQILDTMVRMANNIDTLAITKGLHICIFNKEQMNTLNLKIIKYLYDRWKYLK